MNRFFFAGVLVGVVVSALAGWYSMGRIFGYASKLSRPERVYELSKDVLLYQDGIVKGALFKGVRVDYAGKVENIYHLNLPMGFERISSEDEVLTTAQEKSRSFIEVVPGSIRNNEIRQ